MSDLENHSSDEDEDNVDIVIRADVQNHRDNEPCDVNERTPLYEGSDISKEESKLLILSFLARYNLPDIALNKLLELVNCHLPANAHWHLSKFQLLKKFRSEDVKVYYYCPQCENTIINFGAIHRKNCEECGYICYEAKLKEARNYFLHLPLKNQIS
ncbi:uncharacterized protein LOC105204497 [Solenopsis invicta]|uniref:uncharacterized protein LOC105204497 n=1 Tax=Solenopsis invicta TaxID=13686 RepID=UPI00193CA5B3|nr:uncharacterized protein LOC105204497 [Solenopsis invicta]